MLSLLWGVATNAWELGGLCVSIACLALFFAAIRLRWFSRFRRGFLVTLTAAMIGTGLASSLLVGILSFESAKQIMVKDNAEDMEWLGRYVEREITTRIEKCLAQMDEISSVMMAPAIERDDPKELRDKISGLHRLGKNFVQIDLNDKSGRLLASASSGDAVEPESLVAAAFAVEGTHFISDAYLSTVFNRNILYMSVPARSPGGDILGVLSARMDLGAALSNLLTSTRFGESGYVVLVNHDGMILAHPDPKRTMEDVSAYRAVQLGLKGDSGSLVDLNRNGEKRLFLYRPVNGFGTVNPKPMVLLVEMSEIEASALLGQLSVRLFLGTGLIALACLAIAQQLSRYMKRPLEDLLLMVGRVESGDLSARALISGRDEIGQLGAALNGMAGGLQERDMVKEVFGRYVATQVSEEVLKGKVSLGGECRRVTILFSDIRNFTAMAEHMEPTQVVDFLNDYFSEMVEAVFEYGGLLDKFMGDGMLAVFGSFGEIPDHPCRAVMAALRMKALLGKINGRRSIVGKSPINIGVGIHTDEVVIGNMGSHKRMDYTVVGDGVNTTSRVESLNKVFNTNILITASTYREVSDLFECRLMPEAHAKGKTESLQVYEVLSMKS